MILYTVFLARCVTWMLDGFVVAPSEDVGNAAGGDEEEEDDDDDDSEEDDGDELDEDDIDLIQENTGITVKRQADKKCAGTA